MGLKTKEEYIESIRALKPTAYMFGETHHQCCG